MTTIKDWQRKWCIPDAALADLSATLGAGNYPGGRETGNEATVQATVRLEAAAAGWELWRNNLGAAVDERGVPVRFGLANDSAKLNARIKSADLIGIRPVLITQDMVGSTIGQFASIETKRPGWRFSGTEREDAQMRWATIVTAAGGFARFVTGKGQLV